MSTTKKKNSLKLVLMTSNTAEGGLDHDSAVILINCWIIVYSEFFYILISIFYSSDQIFFIGPGFKIRMIHGSLIDLPRNFGLSLLNQHVAKIHEESLQIVGGNP